MQDRNHIGVSRHHPGMEIGVPMYRIFGSQALVSGYGSANTSGSSKWYRLSAGDGLLVVMVIFSQSDNHFPFATNKVRYRER